MSPPATDAPSPADQPSSGGAQGEDQNHGAARLGQVLSGRYRILQLLGEGGMGAVYLAEHTLMRKRVALKLLHAEMSKNAEVLARFEREAMAAAHIEHPNVAAATDFGRTEDGAFFLVLEYIEGSNLRNALDPGPFAVPRALRVVRQIALALERAHDAGIVHRDLKPENVMLVRRDDDPDFVKVLDFGIAKLSEEAIAERGGAGQPLTRLGTILGTPEYMAPEQALGEAVSAQSDLYAVGIMLYEMLTGLHPFDPPDRMAMLSFHIVAPVPAMSDRNSNIDVPPPVEAIARRLLEKDAKARYPNARALIEAIDGIMSTMYVDASGRLSLVGGRESIVRGPGASPAPPSAAWRSDDSFAKTSYGDAAPPVANALSLPGTSSAGAMGAVGSPPAGYPGGPQAANAPLANAGRGPQQAFEAALETLKKQPRGVLIAVAAALPIGALLMILVAVLAFRRPHETTTTTTGGPSKTESKQIEKSKLASDDRLKTATTAGPDALEALAKEFPEDPRLLPKAALAFHAQGRDTDAMRVASTIFGTGSRAEPDAELVEMVADVAGKPRGDGADGAFALLEGPLGTAGVEALADIASKGATKELRARATRSLAKPEVRGHASPATAVLLDFKSATSCAAKRDMLTRARDDGDARLLGVLRPLKSSRGCGFLGTRDCWPCLRRDGALDDAIGAIETRAPNTPASNPK